MNLNYHKMKFLRLAFYVLIAQLVLSGCAGEAVEETSEKAAEESEAVMLQKAAAEQMQSIAGIVKPDADEDEDDFAERQMQTPEEMLMHMDLGQHTEKEESELEKVMEYYKTNSLGLEPIKNEEIVEDKEVEIEDDMEM